MRSFSVDERRARLARRHFLSRPAGSAGLDGSAGSAGLDGSAGSAGLDGSAGSAGSDGSAVGVAGHFLGLHATDPATPYLTLWARVPGFTVADLDAALFDHRTLVKHLAMRRTLWIVPAEDLPIVQASASDRVADTEHRRLVADAEKAGITADGESWLSAARTAVLAYLAAHGPTGAKDLRAALPQLSGSHNPAPGRRWGGETPLAPRVLTVLGARGDIVRGPNDGRWTTSRPRWTTLTDWLGGAPGPATADAARTELVRRWLRVFGPATETDVKWWFGQTLTWVRQALRSVEAVKVDLRGTEGFALPDDLEPEPDHEPWCALLPALDVTTMGWSDREWYLGDHRAAVFDRNGNAGPTVWVDGRIVGAWRQDASGRVELVLLEDVDRRTSRALRDRAEELTAWLDGVRISPRFPSPACRPAG